MAATKNKGQTKKSGPQNGPGYVYVMKHESKGYKIGYTSRNVKDRLREVQKDHPGTILLDEFKTSEMSIAKNRALDQVKEKLHLKCNGNAGTDWLIETDITVPVDDVIKIVKTQSESEVVSPGSWYKNKLHNIPFKTSSFR